MPKPETITVVVPSYQRPEHLRRCLQGLAAQRRPADRVVVVHRPEDEDTARTATESSLHAQLEAVRMNGVLAAMAVGVAATNADIVAFCDDDAVPREDWIEQIERWFADPGIGAVGGRDWLLPPHPEYPAAELVGIIGKWGRVVGDHHRGAGAPRDVDILKAVNMAFRREAIAFPSGLRGQGAQVHFELAMCLHAATSGWRLIFDPQLLVDHDPAPRFDADRRGRPSLRAVSDATFNATLALLTFRPELRRRRAAYSLLVGDAGSPGFARAAYAVVRRDRETVRRLPASLHGQVAALRRVGRGTALVMRAPGRPGDARRAAP